MRSAAFQKISAVAVTVIALGLGPVTCADAFAADPGWQAPPAKGAEITFELDDEPGWQRVPGEPGWQLVAADSAG
ncbi:MULTISPECIES: hypothetical protein [Streptomyces]|uniref:hypothetical protein n=1 Tax=Streptomyces TaxID=1883 RepID=UPI00367B97BA